MKRLCKLSLRRTPGTVRAMRVWMFVQMICMTLLIPPSTLQAQSCGCPPAASRPIINLSSLSDFNGNLSPNTMFTCTNVYVVDQLTYVPPGGDLLIEPGTVIKGAAGPNKALVVSAGAQIFAQGTATCPIIFTAIDDPLDGTYPFSNKGQWGGLVILGYAPNNLLLADGGNAIGDGVGVLEGFSPSDPRNQYGGFNPNDNSGVLRYISIRHAGGEIMPSVEMNALSLASVGRGTVIEHVETVSCGDDGIEIFGGTVDLRWVSSMFSDDDAFDWDQGWTGRGQFWFGVHLPGEDTGIEGDGDDEDSGNLPASHPTVYNTTFIGGGTQEGFHAKEGTEGGVFNSLFVNFNDGARIDHDPQRVLNGIPTALDKYNNGLLMISNNAYDAVARMVNPDSLQTQFLANNNMMIPGVIDHTFAIDPSNVVLDPFNPVPKVNVSTTNQPPNDGFFVQADYKGAFDPNTTPWTSGWTFADQINLDVSREVIDCPEDINRSGRVDATDYLLFLGKFNAFCSNCPEDINGSGHVDATDYLLLLGKFSLYCPPPAVSVFPPDFSTISGHQILSVEHDTTLEVSEVWVNDGNTSVNILDNDTNSVRREGTVSETVICAECQSSSNIAVTIKFVDDAYPPVTMHYSINKLPVTYIYGEPSGNTITLHAEESYDPEGYPLTYTWYYDTLVSYGPVLTLDTTAPSDGILALLELKDDKNAVYDVVTYDPFTGAVTKTREKFKCTDLEIITSNASKLNGDLTLGPSIAEGTQLSVDAHNKLTKSYVVAFSFEVVAVIEAGPDFLDEGQDAAGTVKIGTTTIQRKGRKRKTANRSELETGEVEVPYEPLPDENGNASMTTDDYDDHPTEGFADTNTPTGIQRTNFTVKNHFKDGDKNTMVWFDQPGLRLKAGMDVSHGFSFNGYFRMWMMPDLAPCEKFYLVNIEIDNTGKVTKNRMTMR
ncbi:MAG: hypothetical protein H6585_08335 [Flavobacteriales bacterium]|nr:hypothetical protein [Flavobacteriales bacterium]MCB9448336.1 hypothetical protein [Flavobacteriales bacterium]